VNPKWLAKAIAITIVAAAVAGYFAFCFLFYQGQWQFVLHPSPMEAVPANLLPSHEDVRFAADSAGQPTMHGWWIPAARDSARPGTLLVYFPGGTGALSSRVSRIVYLHQQQIAIFAFDYRGFGDSEKMRPSQASVSQDAQSVVEYLTQTRHVPLSHMVLFGEGIGSFAATQAAAQNPGVAALALSDPQISQRSIFEADPRTHLLPLKMLLRDDFSLAPALAQMHSPTLVISTFATDQDRKDAQEVYEAIQAPKQVLDAPAGGGAGALTADFDAFLARIFPLQAVTPAGPGTDAATSPRPEK
jgi:hypothetical protein